MQKIDPHFDIIVGTNYSASDYLTLNATDTLSGSVQVDYYYNFFPYKHQQHTLKQKVMDLATVDCMTLL